MAKRPRPAEVAPEEMGDNPTILAEEAADQAEDDVQVEKQPDGGVVLRYPERKKGRKQGHFDNLMNSTDDGLLDDIKVFAAELWEDIRVDIETSTRSVDRYARAIEETGVTGKAPGGAAFAGASTVTHPLLGEVCVDYSARVCREMLPAKGPCKPWVEGRITKEKFDRAKRVARYQNFQIRKKVKNFSTEIEQALAQEPFQGAAYFKWWAEGPRIRCAFIPADKVHRPASADDFYACERITHEQNVTERKIKARMRSGLYAEQELTSPIDPEQTKVEQASDKATGVSPNYENIDRTHTIYETSCFWDGEFDDGISRPYILTQDKDSKQVYALYRNWAEDDEDEERLDFLYEFGFMPFRDGKPIGLTQMLSGIPRAATGALRALLDSALAANFPGATKLKGGQSGSQAMPDPGTITEVENATNVDDIRKLIMPTEVNGPSETLFKLLGFLIDAGRGMVRTTFDDIVGKGRQDIPVGTMMMLVDEGTVVYSSIFARQHRTMGRIMEGLYRLNGQLLAEYPQLGKFSDKDGEDEVTRYDFDNDCCVTPSSDPRINSDTQRWTRANFVVSRADNQLNMGLYNKYETEKMLLEAAEVEQIDLLLVKPQTPHELNAVNENVAAALGRPITAFPDQNHLAHLEVHSDFVKSPMFGAHMAFKPQLAPAMLQHYKEHMALYYAAEALKLVNDAIEPAFEAHPKAKDLLELFKHERSDEGKLSVVDLMRLRDPQLGKAIDKMFAAASAKVMATLEATFVNVLPLLQGLVQAAQQFKPPMPMDPAQASVQTATIGAQAAKEVAGIRAQGDQAKLMHDSQEQAQDRALEQQRIDRQATVDQAKVAATADATDQRHEMNIEDNTTALTIAEAEIAQGGKSAVSTGTGVNPRG